MANGICTRLRDVYNTRTDANRQGTISSDWNRVLLWRDLGRLIAEGFVETLPSPVDVTWDGRERHYFRDLNTGEIYVYVDGWERGSPEFSLVAVD